MTGNRTALRQILELLLELLDISPTHYELARDRGISLGQWLSRKESCLAAYYPDVYPQGSFRYGTVIRPLFAQDAYDLDLVCQLAILKLAMSQKDVKELLLREVRAYAAAKGIKAPVIDKNRCCRLEYADDVSFHMDITPSVPKDATVVRTLVTLGVLPELAQMAVAITDKRHPKFAVIDNDWPSSNPRGFARWFEDRMRSSARPQMEALVRRGVYASVEQVPTYEWKSPLQRSIQILKRHRDVMFKDAQEVKPISMIITTLSALAHKGETDVADALFGIVDRMPTHIRSTKPRIPNPVNPAEDFADAWARDARLETNFGLWHRQVKADLHRLADEPRTEPTQKLLRAQFAVTVGDERLREAIGHDVPSTAPVIAAPSILITSAPKPWRRNG